MLRCWSSRTSSGSPRTTSRNSSASTPGSAMRSRRPPASSTRTCETARSRLLSTSTPPASPILIESAIAMQERAIAWRQAAEEVGVVPTMGALHAGHFNGVLTAVLKLFLLTQPKRADFGQKDFQQLVLVRQMVRDFALSIRIVAVPTVREPDGLAISSRNAYLAPAEREAAPAIYRALDVAAKGFGGGLADPVELEDTVRHLLEGTPRVAIDYVSVVDEITLRRPARTGPGNVLAVAVKLGTIRLIDNVVLGAARL